MTDMMEAISASNPRLYHPSAEVVAAANVPDYWMRALRPSPTPWRSGMRAPKR
jgi:hypothetical protein